MQDVKWGRMHCENQFKYYSFNAPFPIAENGIYRKNQVYQILIRSVNRELIEYLAQKLPKYDNAFMKGLTSELRLIAKRHIAELYSITTAIVKGSEKGYWRDSMSFEGFEERLEINLVKKYVTIQAPMSFS